MMQQLAKLQFSSFGIKLPIDWRDPTETVAANHYGKAFKASEKVTPVPPCPPALFVAASPNKYHTDAAKEISDKLSAYIDGICSAICSAWSQWQSTATLVGVVINAVTAAGGQVVGPPWMPLIMAGAPKATEWELKYSTAIADALSTAWLSYTATIKVPGLPWYPAFAAFPGPVAPPTPNVPVPVAALTQVTAPLAKSALKGLKTGKLAQPEALHAEKLFEALADAFEKCFKIWQTSTMVTNVLGTGPVPTFAPPVVPAGPVVGGIGTMVPGGFA
jgi:hypothetical protein